MLIPGLPLFISICFIHAAFIWSEFFHQVQAVDDESSRNKEEPLFPLQISAQVEITAHLVDPKSEYPPRTRRMTIYYDYIQKRARADIEEGYEAAKTYIRQYGNKNEYMIRLPPINDCKRAYLGEVMPFPELPGELISRNVKIRDYICNYFRYMEHNVVIHMYIEVNTGRPVQLIQSHLENQEETPMLTYDYLNVELGPQSDELFLLPQGFTHKTCDRITGGFPYLHAFHYFVRF